jgi:hypothetical protein
VSDELLRVSVAADRADAPTSGAQLRAKYGNPERVADRAKHILAWRHASEESARAFAAANGSEGSVWYEDGEWLSVVDMRARIAELDAQYRQSFTATYSVADSGLALSRPSDQPASTDSQRTDSQER